MSDEYKEHVKPERLQINVDELGQILIKFVDGLSFIVHRRDETKNSFIIRSLDHKFVVHMSGAVNLLEIEMKRYGE